MGAAPGRVLGRLAVTPWMWGNGDLSRSGGSRDGEKKRKTWGARNQGKGPSCPGE